MNRIKNIIFDLGGVLLDLDVHRCLERLEGIGLHEVRQWRPERMKKVSLKNMSVVH